MEERKYTYKLRNLVIAVGIAEALYWSVVGLLWLFREELFPGIIFDHPRWIAYSTALPVLALLYLVGVRRKNKGLRAFSETRLLPYLTSAVSTPKSLLRFLLVRFGLGLLFIALANPKLPSEVEENMTYSGIDIIIALDVSKSMMAEDIKPNRLERSKLSISNLISELHGNRIGMLAFAGNVDKVFPLTIDYSFAKSKVSKLSTDYIAKQGTDIGGAIEAAINSFNLQTPATKTIIVITDGEDHQNSAALAAAHAQELGISVHTIGIGSPNGVPIPEYKDGVKSGYKTDANGETVVTKLNLDVLREIAMAGQGSALLASGSQVGLAPLVQELHKNDEQEFSQSVVLSYENEFQLFLAVAIALLALEFLISERRSRLADRIKLFD